MQFENDEEAIEYLRSLQSQNPPEYEPIHIYDAMKQVVKDIEERQVQS